MARTPFTATVGDRAFNVIQGARMVLSENETDTPVTDAFPSAVGGAAQSVFITNADGQIKAWFDEPKLIRTTTTNNGGTAHYPGTPSALLPSFTEVKDDVPVYENPTDEEAQGFQRFATLEARDAVTTSADGALSLVTPFRRGFVWDDINSEWAPIDASLDVRDYVKGDGSNDHSALQEVLYKAAADNLALHNPWGVNLYIAELLDIPDGLRWIGDGEGSLITSDVVGEFSVGQALAKTRFEISGLAARRTNALDGTEGPFDAMFDIRNSDDWKIHHIIPYSFMTGVGIFECKRYRVYDIDGHSQGDCTVRINPGGSGTTGQHGSSVSRVTSYNAGYALDGVTPLPNPGGPLGSAFLCTDHTVQFDECVAVNPRYNAFESGENPDAARDIKINSMTAIADTAGRVANVLVNGLAHSSVNDLKLIGINGGRATLYAPNNSVDDITIDGVTGHGYVAVVVSSAKNPKVRNVDLDLEGEAVIGVQFITGTTPAVLEHFTVRNGGIAGVNIVGGGRDTTEIRRGRVWDCGQDAPDVDGQIGFLFQGSGTAEDCVAGETRSGGARTQRQGYYIASGEWIWRNMRAPNNLIAPVRAEAGVVLRSGIVQEAVAPATSAAFGFATLVGGTVVVSTAAVTALSVIRVHLFTLGTVLLPATLGVTARTPGTSFTIKSADVTDTSVVGWEIVEPLR